MNGWIGISRVGRRAASIGACAASGMLLADNPDLRQVVITGRADSLLEISRTSSEGYVGRDHLDQRPVQRPGEVLETVPGLVATQHSGNGKANQYFLRGFNLDHGTDFATTLDGIPVNLPTHAHGQGYTDLNPLIPELIDTVHYRKGPYFADVGDFGSAGAADIRYVRELPRTLVSASGGSFGYARGLVAGSPHAGGGHLLYALEAQHEDGPWVRKSDSQKYNGLLKYSRGDAASGWSATFSGYGGRWHSTDQIPVSAVDVIPGRRFGTLDPSDGGDSQRYTLALEGHYEQEAGHGEWTMFGGWYDLDLYSNFTYFLDDPVRGDQFRQRDERTFGGLRGHHTWHYDVGSVDVSSTVGLQIRGDSIDNALERSQSREVFGVTRADQVGQVSVSPYVETAARFTPWFRTQAGIRADWYSFDVESDRPENSGTRTDFLASPKLTAVFGPWAKTEISVGAGMGFHSNDGRGALTRVDPVSGDPADRVDPLVRTHGAEIGVRTMAVPGLQSSVTFWMLDIDSELLFVGDAGSTEASRPSRRYGVEFANYWKVGSWVTLDADLSLSHSRFRDEDPAGAYIPGSVRSVVAAGVTVRDPDAERGFFGSLRLRYFGPRPLEESNTRRSGETVLLNAQLGWRFNRTWSVAVDAFNLLDRADSDIDYFYESAITPGAALEQRHFHPVEPISARVTLSARF